MRRCNRRAIQSLYALLAVMVSGGCLVTSTRAAPSLNLTAAQRAALSHISALRLRRHVEYLAADELEGRATPSHGLDLAADYIADQFGCGSLEPLPDGSYFQQGTEVSHHGVQGRPRNVIGWLPGSDPALKDSFVLLTAHYDHLGVRPGGAGDRIFNGANDNASGVAALIEAAAALAHLVPRPRRSVVFIAFYGEEDGMLGSRYYCQHPAFPLERTAAVLNLEQLGRTDSARGPQVARASVTGFDYSSVGRTLRESGEQVGITVFRDPPDEATFFSRSDNHVFASRGVPAHTIYVAYEYPDYHQVTDHADKIDFGNLEQITRMVAAGALSIAEASRAPEWTPGISQARHYRLAWRELHH